MTYLTVQEVAELAGCEITRIKRMAQNNKINFKMTVNERNRPQYRFPLDSLPDDIRRRYYSRLKGGTVNMLPVDGEENAAVH